jgi:hypothetical protein
VTNIPRRLVQTVSFKPGAESWSLKANYVQIHLQNDETICVFQIFSSFVWLSVCLPTLVVHKWFCYRLFPRENIGNLCCYFGVLSPYQNNNQRFKSKKTTTIFFSVFYKRMQYRANVSVVGQVTNSRPSVRNSCKIVSSIDFD